MSDIYARTFETKEAGQIIVMKTTNDDNKPCIKTYFKPKELGVCSYELSYKDTEEGEELRDKKFFEIKEEQILNNVLTILKKFE